MIISSWLTKTFPAIILLACNSTRPSIGQITISTFPDTDDNTVASLAIKEGESGSLMCNVHHAINQQQPTSWFIWRSNIDEKFKTIVSNTEGTITGPEGLTNNVIITDYVSYANFTIKNFTSQFDTTQVQCGTFTIRRTFKLGFPVTPTVLDSIDNQVVTEGNSTNLTLSLKGSMDPFPSETFFHWFFEGKNLSNNTNILISDYNIMLSNISRNLSGIYKLEVGNSFGSSTGSFHLDVQFASEVTILVDSKTVLSGSNITLQSFSSINGNPKPLVSWIGPNGESIDGNNSRFGLLTPGKITIKQVTLEDNGTYSCLVSNGIGEQISQNVTLRVAVPAGPPENFVLMNVTDTTVALSFSPPNSSGIPPFSGYHIVTTPLTQSGTYSDKYVTTVSVLITGLLPNTNYNVTSAAVSYDDNTDVVEGEVSNAITFMTKLGVPLLKSFGVSLGTNDANIKITWTLAQTGGLDITTYVSCDSNGLNLTWSSSQSDNDANHNQLNGNIVFGPVEALNAYTCTIMVVNLIGKDTQTANNTVISNLGLPSTPNVFVKQCSCPGEVNLTVNMDTSGTTDSNVTIYVEIYSAHDGLPRIEEFPISKYQNNQNVTIVLYFANGGYFNISVKGKNSFGFSRERALIENINIQADSIVSPIISATLTTSDSKNQGQRGLIEGSVSLSIIFLCVLVGFIITLAIAIYKSKGKKRSLTLNFNDPPIETQPNIVYEIFNTKARIGRKDLKKQSSMIGPHSKVDPPTQANIVYDTINVTNTNRSHEKTSSASIDDPLTQPNIVYEAIKRKENTITITSKDGSFNDPPTQPNIVYEVSRNIAIKKSKDRRDLERITGSLSIDDPPTQPNIVYGAVKRIATNTRKTITTDKDCKEPNRSSLDDPPTKPNIVYGVLKTNPAAINVNNNISYSEIHLYETLDNYHN